MRRLYATLPMTQGLPTVFTVEQFLASCKEASSAAASKTDALRDFCSEQGAQAWVFPALDPMAKDLGMSYLDVQTVVKDLRTQGLQVTQMGLCGELT